MFVHFKYRNNEKTEVMYREFTTQIGTTLKIRKKESGVCQAKEISKSGTASSGWCRIGQKEFDEILEEYEPKEEIISKEELLKALQAMVKDFENEIIVKKSVRDAQTLIEKALK